MVMMDPAFEQQRGRVIRDINSLLISVCEGKGIALDRITSNFMSNVISFVVTFVSSPIFPQGSTA